MKSIYKHLNRRIISIALLLIFVLMLFVQIQESKLYGAVISADYEYIKITASDTILYAYVFMLLIMIIQNSFTVIPLLLVITINIAIFGFLKGFLWSWFTSVIAAVVIFLFIRYLFTDRFSSKVSPEQLKKIKDKGVSYILVARIFPFIPTSFINIIAGLSTITLKNFIIGTALGNFIYFFILALIPAGLLSGGINEYVIAASIILLPVLYYFLSKIKGKNNDTKLIRNKC